MAFTYDCSMVFLEHRSHNYILEHIGGWYCEPIQFKRDGDHYVIDDGNQEASVGVDRHVGFHSSIYFWMLCCTAQL